MLNLCSRDIAADAINLRDSKIGPRAVPLGEAARALIEALPCAHDPEAFLFPRHAEGRGIWILTNCWRTGENLPLVGKLLGHRRHRNTAGYAHLADGHLVDAAEKVGAIIAEAMAVSS